MKQFHDNSYTPEKMALLKESIEKYGQLVPITVERRSGYILDGNARFQIIAEMIDVEPIIHYVDLDLKESELIEARISISGSQKYAFTNAKEVLDLRGISFEE